VNVYPPADLERFLRAVDSALSKPVHVTVIGGAAAAIRYGAHRATRDVDTWTLVPEELAAAVEEAHRATGIDVPFAKSGVADAPWDFESRLARALPDLERLVIHVPERHDLVLMKIVRGHEHDLELIEDMHTSAPESGHTRPAVPGRNDACRIRSSAAAPELLTLVERLFPRDLQRVSVRLK
jgi:hypothetical protein